MRLIARFVDLARVVEPPPVHPSEAAALGERDIFTAARELGEEVDLAVIVVRAVMDDGRRPMRAQP